MKSACRANPESKQLSLPARTAHVFDISLIDPYGLSAKWEGRGAFAIPLPSSANFPFARNPSTAARRLFGYFDAVLTAGPAVSLVGVAAPVSPVTAA